MEKCDFACGGVKAKQKHATKNVSFIQLQNIAKNATAIPTI
jgi:hypothetical protein